MIFALSLVFACVVLSAVGQVAMKTGMAQVGHIGSLGQLLHPSTLLSIFTTPRVLIGVALYAVSLGLWLGRMSTLNISFMYPLASTACVVAAVLAYVFLKEPISALHRMGIALVGRAAS